LIPGLFDLWFDPCLMSDHSVRFSAPALALCILATAHCPVFAAVDIDALIASMTLDEKIGQMTMAERSSASPDDVRNFFLGSILSGGGSAPNDNSPTGWADMHDALQNAALQTRLQIPIVYGIDAVHGHNNVYGATIFPHNIGLGATRDPNLMEEIGRITALEVAATGLEWNFAPCVAVSRDERWGRSYESFGEDPNLQVLLAGRYVLGLQGSSMSGQHIIACAKHFIGDGGTSGGVDRGNTVLDEASLRSIHLPGFLEALDKNVGTVMPSYSSWNGVKMHEQGYLLTDVLKGELGFDGFVISDWEAVYELSGATYYDQVVQMVNAGVDMGMEPNNWQNWISTLKSAVINGDVPISRINDAVRRILRIKDRAGLFDQPLADRSLVNGGFVGHLTHRDVAREAVQKSLVLLKNDGVLPLAKNLNVFVAGKNADNIGHQCGGWTIDWQGGSGSITPGTTILEGIQSQVTSGGGTVTFSEDGTGSAGHDVAIVVIGETPYAEGYGDDTSLALDALDMACLSRIADIPTVVVLVSGRALMISDHINSWNAFVSAWLPGTEGDGIAEVLFGNEDFTGKLPISWPLDINQVPINLGDVSYNPLFPYGFGLDYSSLPPSVTITGPLEGATLPAGNIQISATASDPNGTIVAVEFYAGANFIAADMTAPYQITWPAVGDGCYTLLAKAIDDDGLSGTDSIDITVGAGCDGQVPFFGTPITIPGIIQAEHYDLGGASVAYLDADASNNGGAYRTDEGVDLEACSDSGGGYNVGWMSGGEWIEYSVDVTIPGEYRIDSRVASQGTGGSFHLEFFGQDQTGAILVPVTGGWQTWTTVSTPVDLSAGRQIMRFANSSSSDEYNLNYLEFVLLHPLGDIDRDGDVDSDDFDAASLCLGGPEISISQPCTTADREQDNDVDMADYAIAQQESVGPVP
jgi:beta-glucosidase